MSEIKKDNHYIPRFYLNQWNNSNKKVFVYQRLVSSTNVPLWTEKSVKSIGKQMHLYTQFENNQETFEVENWFEKEYETPVQEAYQKAISDKKLTCNEWERLIRFLACEYVRTPVFYLKHKKIIQDNFLDIVENVISNITPEKIKQHQANKALGDAPKGPKLDKVISVNVNRENSTVETAFWCGRDSWIEFMKHALERTYKILLEHKWSIVTVDESVILPTCDNPVVLLNYNNAQEYNLNGGWGVPNGDIVFPLSPNKIMFTEIGKNIKSRSAFNKETSEQMKIFIIRNAYRYVYSNYKIKNMIKNCPRDVDTEKFNQEKEAWQNWNVQQRIPKKGE